MRFNGIDVLTVHYALTSIDKEIPPGGAARNITTVSASGGDMVASVDVAQDEYILRINMAASTYDEAMLAREALAAWAMTGKPAELEPTHMPGKAYTAICKGISKFENRFAPVDVTFLLPRPILHSITESSGGSGQTSEVWIGGTASVQPVFTFVASAAASVLTVSIDGKVFYTISTAISAGDEVIIQPEVGVVTKNGVDVSAAIDYTTGDPDMEMAPGKHTIAASAAGSLTVRWHDQWQ